MSDTRLLTARHGDVVDVLPAEGARVLRNTHALLAATLLVSAGTAAASAAYQLPAAGLIVTLVGFYGLLFAIHKLQRSAWSIGLVFVLTAFMGYTLGPLLGKVAALPGGSQTIALALGATGLSFLATSAYAVTTRRDLSFMGGMLMVGMIVALVAGIAGIFLQIPALSLTVSAMVALLSAGLIMYETNQIVRGGQTNYVLATVNLYVSIFNLFTSLLSLLGFSSSSND